MMKAGIMMKNNIRKGFGNMTRYTLALAFALVTFFGMSNNIVSAQEILLEGPLAGAPAIRKKIQYRNLRFSLGPQFGYTILNDYMHNFMLGIKLEFNVTDWLGIGAVGFYSFNAPTHLTNHIENSKDIGGASTTPSDSNWPSYTGSHNFKDQVALLKGMFMGQVSFVPLRGKLAVFEKLFVSIDGYLFVGGGVVLFKERSPCTSNADEISNGGTSCGDLSDFQNGGGTVTRENAAKGTFTVGIGFTTYFNDWIGLNLEYRLAPFKWNAAGTDEAGQAGTQWVMGETSDGSVNWQTTANGAGDYPDGRINKEDQTWNSNQSIIIGVVFNLPPKARITN
jgi:outer membrane beta-barrel protein